MTNAQHRINLMLVVSLFGLLRALSADVTSPLMDLDRIYRNLCGRFIFVRLYSVNELLIDSIEKKNIIRNSLSLK